MANERTSHWVSMRIDWEFPSILEKYCLQLNLKLLKRQRIRCGLQLSWCGRPLLYAWLPLGDTGLHLRLDMLLSKLYVQAICNLWRGGWGEFFILGHLIYSSDCYHLDRSYLFAHEAYSLLSKMRSLRNSRKLSASELLPWQPEFVGPTTWIVKREIEQTCWERFAYCINPLVLSCRRVNGWKKVH